MESTEFLLLDSKTLHPLYKENVPNQDCQLTGDFVSYRFSNEHSGGSTKLDILDLYQGSRTESLKKVKLFKEGEKSNNELYIIGDTKTFESVIRIVVESKKYNANYIEFRDFYDDDLIYWRELAYHE
jgi:hypothetical protein